MKDMETKNISLKQLIDRLRRHPILSNINEETIIDYTIDFFRIMGLPTAYQEKTAYVKIVDYCGKLPEDLLEIIQVRGVNFNCAEFKENIQYKEGTILYYNNDVWKLTKDKNEGAWDDTIVEKININAAVQHFVYSTNTFHLSENKTNVTDNSYKIQGEKIYTNNREDFVEIAYYAIEVDDCGLPVIPDNAKFIRALENYIKVQHFTIQFELGKLAPAILQHAEQEYCWSVGACESDFHSISLDKLESILKTSNSYILNYDYHNRGYSFPHNYGEDLIIKKLLTSN